MASSKKEATREPKPRGGKPKELQTLVPLLEVKNNPYRGPSLYSVALSSDGSLLAMGQSDGAVRVFDVVRGRSTRIKLRGTVTALALNDTHAVAIAGGAEHRIAIKERTAKSLVFLGAEQARVAIRGNRYAIGGDNAGTGLIEGGVDSYYGMPVATRDVGAAVEELFGLVALNADGTKVAAVREVSAREVHAGKARSARLFCGSTETGPTTANELLQWEPKPHTRLALGFIGDRVVLAEACDPNWHGAPVPTFEVWSFDGSTRSVFVWLNDVRPACVTFCEEFVIAVGEDGRVARMALDGTCTMLSEQRLLCFSQVDPRRVVPWSMASASADGTRIALAYPYGASVYSIG